jgi:hypothetical protein
MDPGSLLLPETLNRVTLCLTSNPVKNRHIFGAFDRLPRLDELYLENTGHFYYDGLLEFPKLWKCLKLVHITWPQDLELLVSDSGIQEPVIWSTQDLSQDNGEELWDVLLGMSHLDKVSFVTCPPSILVGLSSMPWIYEVGMIDVIWNLSEDERLVVGALEGVDIIFERSEARSSADLDEIGFWGVHPCGRFKGNIMSTIPDGVEDDI